MKEELEKLFQQENFLEDIEQEMVQRILQLLKCIDKHGNCKKNLLFYVCASIWDTITNIKSPWQL